MTQYPLQKALYEDLPLSDEAFQYGRVRKQWLIVLCISMLGCFAIAGYAGALLLAHRVPEYFVLLCALEICLTILVSLAQHRLSAAFSKLCLCVGYDSIPHGLFLTFLCRRNFAKFARELRLFAYVRPLILLFNPKDGDLDAALAAIDDSDPRKRIAWRLITLKELGLKEKDYRQVVTDAACRLLIQGEEHTLEWLDVGVGTFRQINADRRQHSNSGL